MKKSYIRMNDNKHLSLGNVFNIMKSISKGKSAMQSEIFCSIFDAKDINPTTVNNYCIGIRAIGVEYKNYYSDLYDKFKNNKEIFIDTVLRLISILDEHVYIKDNDSINIINNNHSLKDLCVKLLDISKIDENIQDSFTNDISKLIDKEMLYECIIELLRYAIIENKQPVFSQNINIKINKKELDEYLSIKLFEGVSYITSLISLSKKGNIYACADLGSLEFDGIVSGNPNYDRSFYYYMIAANRDHPRACWMIANMILTKKVDYDFDVLWKYLNKAIKLGSAAALNTMGKCYLEGINPDNKIDIDLAKKYFVESGDLGYTFAFNNLGMIEEKSGNIEESLKYYKMSADMGESWALNKVGEYYRINNNMDIAYIYYKKSFECPLSERCKWAKYNIDKYYSKEKCKND